jgi:hypothetical protein
MKLQNERVAEEEKVKKEKFLARKRLGLEKKAE